jgi:hypothetical protein
VGLTGFRCRCGDLFCGAHRYSDRHGCRYDYRGAARDAIARENPVVRAAKIVRFWFDRRAEEGIAERENVRFQGRKGGKACEIREVFSVTTMMFLDVFDF